MKRYEKPVVYKVEQNMEGVYLASGAGTGTGDCYDASAYFTQTPKGGGAGIYCIQVNGKHAATDNHHSGEQILTLSFSQPVTYNSSKGTLVGGDGTDQLSIKYNYHNNASDNIGLADIYVQAEAGLAITGAQISCNYDCGQH